MARVDAALVHQNYGYATFTNHPLVYYGDIREKVQDLARLIGLQVIEEDKLREERGR